MRLFHCTPSHVRPSVLDLPRSKTKTQNPEVEGSARGKLSQQTRSRDAVRGPPRWPGRTPHRAGTVSGQHGRRKWETPLRPDSFTQGLGVPIATPIAARAHQAESRRQHGAPRKVPRPRGSQKVRALTVHSGSMEPRATNRLQGQETRLESQL